MSFKNLIQSIALFNNYLENQKIKDFKDIGKDDLEEDKELTEEQEIQKTKMLVTSL